MKFPNNEIEKIIIQETRTVLKEASMMKQRGIIQRFKDYLFGTTSQSTARKELLDLTRGADEETIVAIKKATEALDNISPVLLNLDDVGGVANALRRSKNVEGAEELADVLEEIVQGERVNRLIELSGSAQELKGIDTVTKGLLGLGGLSIALSTVTLLVLVKSSPDESGRNGARVTSVPVVMPESETSGSEEQTEKASDDDYSWLSDDYNPDAGLTSEPSAPKSLSVGGITPTAGETPIEFMKRAGFKGTNTEILAAFKKAYPGYAEEQLKAGEPLPERLLREFDKESLDEPLGNTGTGGATTTAAPTTNPAKPKLSSLFNMQNAELVQGGGRSVYTDGVYFVGEKGKVFKRNNPDERPVEIKPNDMELDLTYSQIKAAKDPAAQAPEVPAPEAAAGAAEAETAIAKPTQQASSRPNFVKTNRTLDQVAKGETYFRPGDMGEGVKEMQKLVVKALEGEPTLVGPQGIDGKYGGATKKAVEALQKSLGFKGRQVDGLYGPKTHKALLRRQDTAVASAGTRPTDQPAAASQLPPSIEEYETLSKKLQTLKTSTLPVLKNKFDRLKNDKNVRYTGLDGKPVKGRKASKSMENDIQSYEEQIENIERVIRDYEGIRRALSYNPAKDTQDALKQRLATTEQEIKSLVGVSESIINESTYNRWQKLIKN